jgi:putative membrane protein
MVIEKSQANPVARPIARHRTSLIILAVGVLLWWSCRYHASLLPAILPWDFSWAWFLAYAFSGLWYARGMRGPARQPLWRTGFFLVGMLAMWAVLQTRFEYLAQHMFFMNRIQHVAMHHLGPFLVAIAWPWATIRAGMPPLFKRALDHRTSQQVLRFVQSPDIACLLFVGLIVLWLIPSVHFVAMLDPLLYQVMNWSMVVDGLLFWSVVLDPRPAELAHNGFAARALIGVGVMFPQIVIGAVLAFTHRDLYSFYAWCGRIYPGIDALADQHIGGLIAWIPPAMMSALSLILVLNNSRIDSERNAPPGDTILGVSSSSWTGR